MSCMIYKPKESLIQFPSLWLPGSSLPSSRGLGRRCCCIECTQFEDSFTRSNSTNLGSDWSEEAGDWQILGNTLAVDSGSTVCTCQASLTLPYVILCSVSSTSSTNTAKVIWDYTDTNNYTYLHVTFNSALQWKIYRKVSGSDTELDSVTVSLTTTGTTIYIKICVTATVAFVGASLNTSSYLPYLAADEGASQTECGLGTTTQGSANAIRFYNFDVETNSSSCSQCRKPCYLCSEGYGPQAWQVVINGMAGAGTCDNFDGTWILQKDSGSCQWTTGALDFVFDSDCSQTSEIVLKLMSASSTQCSYPETHNTAMNVYCGYGPPTECTVAGCYASFLHTQVGDYDCDSVSGMDVPSHAAGTTCTVSGATCTVTAL